MKPIFSLALLLLIAVMSPSAAEAHVLLRDNTAKVGATFHLTPDDDPVAGEESRLYFDIQDSDSNVRVPYDIYELQIRDSNGMTKKIDLTANNNTLSASYIFPSQGVYDLTLRSRPEYDVNKQISMEYVLRVDRGISVSPKENASNQWAQVLMILSLSGAALMLIVGFNYREVIAKNSKL